MRELAKIPWRDLMNQNAPIHWVLFLSCDAFVEYISIRIVHLHLKYYGLFLYRKYSSNLTIASKMFMKCVAWQWGSDITVSTHCDVTMVRWHCYNFKTSQSLCGVAFENWDACDRQPGSFTQDPGTPGSFIQDPGTHGSFIQDPGYRTTWIFHLKPGPSRHHRIKE